MAVNLELDERDEGSFRRSWSAAFKKRILEEIDAAPAGEKGVILRWSLTVLLDLSVASVCCAASLRRFHDA